MTAFLVQAMEEKFAAEWGQTDSEESDYMEEDEEGNPKTGDGQDLEDLDEELPLAHLYCVACNKAFKTEKSYVQYSVVSRVVETVLDSDTNL